MRKATGSYLPLFSQGFRVCLSPPCTDEPRLRLEPGDIIKVTRFRQHWLFGERTLNEGSQKDDVRQKQPLRGWFPRRCVIELIQPEQPPISDEEDYEVNTKHERVKQKTTSHTNSGNSSQKKGHQNGHCRKKNN